MNTPVSFKIAKLLKEKGFDEPCRAAIVSMSAPFYSRGLTTNTELSKEKLPTLMSAPTIADVVMWLYEKHGIWIKVDVAAKDFWHPSILNIEDGSFKVHPSYVSQKFVAEENRMFNSPTEVYESAIEYTLNNLI